MRRLALIWNPTKSDRDVLGEARLHADLQPEGLVDGVLHGARTALPWALYPDVNAQAEQALLTPHLYEFDANRLTCCGGAASIDFALTLVELLFGATAQAQVKETLCIVRAAHR